MANTKQAKKRARQNPKRELRNTMKRSAMRTSVKKTLKNINDKSSNAATSVKESSTLLDRYARKGIIHKNKAARLKSRLNKKLRATGSKAA